AFGDGDVGAHGAWGLHESERDRIEADDEERARGMAAFAECGVVGEGAVKTWILDDDARGAFGVIAVDDVESELRSMGVEHAAVRGIDRRMHDDTCAV